MDIVEAHYRKAQRDYAEANAEYNRSLTDGTPETMRNYFAINVQLLRDKVHRLRDILIDDRIEAAGLVEITA